MVEEKLENGAEVLVFEYNEWYPMEDRGEFIKGTIIDSKLSDDLSYHGSSWNVMCYTVLGEDGKKYFGNLGHHLIGGSFFMTKEDYIRHLNHKIAYNEEKIAEIEKENERFTNLIEKVQNIEIELIEKDNQKGLSRKR